MTDIQIDGSTQIQPLTILDAAIATSAAIATDKLAQGALFLLSNGSVVWTGALNAGSYQLNYLAAGTASTDAVNLGQVNSLISAAVTSGVTPLTWEGSWASGTTYSVNQVVSYNNGVYISILGSNTGNEPDTATTYWAIMCAGIAGPTGATGTRGSLIYVASGAPGTISGQLNNDLYINSANSYLYQLVGGTWTYQLTLGGGGGGSGTVTSVGLTLPGLFSVSGSPVTTSGTLSASLATQTANEVFAGPTSGSAAAPTFRSLVTADLPALTSSLITDFATAVNALISTALAAGSLSFGPPLATTNV